MNVCLCLISISLLFVEFFASIRTWPTVTFSISNIFFKSFLSLDVNKLTILNPNLFNNNSLSFTLPQSFSFFYANCNWVLINNFDPDLFFVYQKLKKQIFNRFLSTKSPLEFVVNSHRLFCNKKLMWNVRIKAFWYKNTI